MTSSKKQYNIAKDKIHEGLQILQDLQPASDIFYDNISIIINKWLAENRHGCPADRILTPNDLHRFSDKLSNFINKELFLEEED